MDAQQAATRVQIGVASREAERRHSNRSDSALQNRFRLELMRLVAAALLPATALSLGVSYMLIYPALFFDPVWVPAGFTVTGIGAGLWILRQCDRVSNRYCGPNRRIIGTLEAIRRGERPAPVRVRKGDAFEQLARELNETFAKLGVMDPSDR